VFAIATLDRRRSISSFVKHLLQVPPEPTPIAEILPD